MRLYLAIDGGNSKTDAVIGTEHGDVLAYVRGPGTCHQNIGLPATMTRLSALVAQARAAAALDETLVLERADIFLAGADLPAEIAMLSEAIQAQGWASSLRLSNDAIALLRAGTDAPDAVAVVCGQGVNCVARRGDGRGLQFPSLGLLSGDWGGGGQLGQLALWHAVRAGDGRGPATSLERAIAIHYGLSSAEELGFAIHLGHRGEDLGELAPLVFREADAGDRVARSLVAQQAAEIVTMATAAARRLDLTDEPFAVVLGGGVVRARHPLLINPVVSGIQAVAPKASVTVVDAPPVLGAALFSLDAFDAGPDARTALRATLTALAPLS
jgi:N-acetylglucosamine kinase-like BadF-type ATPase